MKPYYPLSLKIKKKKNRKLNNSITKKYNKIMMK